MIPNWYDIAMLAAESQHVIWLRTMKLAMGGSHAEREAQLMVEEKFTAATQAGLHLMMGGSPESVIQNYRKKVQANVLRLQVS